MDAMELDPVEEPNQLSNPASPSLQTKKLPPRPPRNERIAVRARREPKLASRHKKAARKPPVPQSASEQRIHQARQDAKAALMQAKIVQHQELRDQHVTDGCDPPEITSATRAGEKAFIIWHARQGGQERKAAGKKQKAASTERLSARRERLRLEQ